jgi:hypothetical protein
MPTFTDDEIASLFDAACTAGIADCRDVLISGFDPAFVVTLKTGGSPAGQLLLDLHGLNADSAQVGGTPPFATWLLNAIKLSGQRPEAMVFRDFRARLQGGHGTLPPEPPTSDREGGRASRPSSALSRLADWAVSGLSLVAMATVAWIAVSHGKGWQVARAWGDYVQLAVVAVFCVGSLVATPSVPKGPGEKASRCRKYVRDFTYYWRMLWLTWVVFYTVHTMRHLLQQTQWGTGEAPRWWTVGVPWLLNFMHNVQGVIMLILFWTMVRPKKTNARGVDQKDHHIIGWVACVIFSMVEAFLLYSTHHAGAGHLGMFAAELWPALIVGVFNATCMAMLVGTLETAFLEVGAVELIALYAYAAIQPLFRFTVLGEFAPELQDPAQIIDLVLKSFALAFKLGLFFVVHRRLTSGRLAFYMWKVRDLPPTIPAEWQAFKRGPLAAVPVEE